MKIRLFTLLATFLAHSVLFSQTINYWEGYVDTAWDNTANWSLNHVPYSSENVVIKNVTNSPVLTINTAINAIQINAGATLDLNGKTLTLTADWNNSGTVNANQGKVIFSGSQKQYVYGQQSFYHLDINNTNGVEIASDTSGVKGTLTVTNGTFTTNGALVIESDSTGTGNVAPISGTVSGDVTVQRYIPISFQDWRLISSPVKDATLNEIKDDMWTTGFPGSMNPGHWFTSVYLYDETVGGQTDNGWVAPSSIDDTLQAGEGFYTFMGTASFSGDLDFTGPLRNGTANINVNFTDHGSSDDGWNLIGNPFASTIDWDDANITRNNIYNAIYIWNPELGTYASYVNGISSNGGSNLIASCQAFWVKASGANPSLEIPQAAKSNSSTPFIKQSQNQYLTISLSNGSMTDETVLKSNPDATENFEGNYDALKFSPTNGNNPTIYSGFSNHSEIYSINQFEEAEKVVQLYARTGISGTHTLEFNGVDAFDKSKCVVLRDLFTGQEYSLTEGQSISVDLSDTTTIPRFELHIGAPLNTTTNNISCNGNNDGEILLDKITDSIYNVTWKNELGTIIQQDNNIYQTSSLTNLEEGTYYAEISDQLCGQSVDTFVITQPAQILADFTATQDTVYLDGSGSSVFVDLQNTSQNASFFKWATDNDVYVGPVYTMEIDNAGIHQVTLYAYQKANCFESIQKDIVAISTASVEEENPFSNSKVYSFENKLKFSGLQENTTINISGVNGQLLYSGVLNTSGIVELNNLSTQVLIVQMISGDRQRIEKVFLR